MGERCVLCGFVLDERAVVVSEGKLCNDSMGCRRRALRLIENLRKSARQLRKAN